MIWPIVIFGSIVFLAGTALLFLMTRRRLLKGSALAKIRASWLHAVGQVNPTLKIVEADKVLDEALKLLGYSGSLGDKLKSAGPRFKHQSDLWSAHKLRNRLVHELNSVPKADEVSGALRIYERALKELGL
ncbi:hypothetical protein A3A67_04475 [Candidatus Peribacteria bacterium RIFCSPLOWO2_01_FULL_51_18]|nr:MAG: hypothetical protein A3A67_04475 [Candidatus Peribacteria bacterium RIFCSPLOWO2_01_FULL_51_18]OGJ68008.1 MAG: hypothetical protein A3J34_05000 [Candidatus Peribacteria bacterium RIFCSPLOWO2_02_FULL_51_10]